MSGLRGLHRCYCSNFRLLGVTFIFDPFLVGDGTTFIFVPFDHGSRDTFTFDPFIMGFAATFTFLSFFRASPAMIVRNGGIPLMRLPIHREKIDKHKSKVYDFEKESGKRSQTYENTLS
jgi:hypothetical protein